MTNAGAGEPGAKTAAELSFTPLLLTGGLSRRMGQDKATLQAGGEPLWSRQLTLLESLGFGTVWISARMHPDWAPQSAKILLDVPPSRGPLSGIAVALEQMKTTHLLALAVDLPDMPLAHLRKLVGFAQPRKGVLPVTPEHFEPLAAIYPKEAEATAQIALGSNRLAMHGVAAALLELGLLREYRLTASERPFYHNLNSKADAAKLE